MSGVRECRVARRSDLASMGLGGLATGFGGFCGVVSASSSCGGGNCISLDAGQTFLIAFDCAPSVSGGSRSQLGGSHSHQEASRSAHGGNGLFQGASRGGGECGDSGQSDRSRFTHRCRSRTGQTHSGETQCHRRIEAGHRHHCLRRNQDIGRSPHHRSRRAYRASQPFGAHAQFRRLDHPHVESQTGRSPRLPSLGEDRHCPTRERQRTALPRDRHANPVCRSVRHRRQLAPLGKHQRRNRPVVCGSISYHHGIGNSYLRRVDRETRPNTV